MELRRTVDLLTRFRARIADNMYAAKVYGSTSQTMYDMIRGSVQLTTEYAKLPRWARAELEGYEHALRDAFYRYEHIWALKHEGVWYPAKHPALEGKYNSTMQGAHVWREHFEKGQVRIYYGMDLVAEEEAKCPVYKEE